MTYTIRKKRSTRRKKQYKSVKRRYRGGGSSAHTSVAVQSYPLEPGTSSQRESAMQSGLNMNAKQQSLVNTHGGGRRKKIRSQYSKSCKRYKGGCKSCKRYKGGCNSCKRYKGGCNSCNRYKGGCNSCNRYKGGSSSGATTTSSAGDTVVVPTFNNSGSSVSPVNANSISAASNSTNMQSNANAANDCYATGTCSGGGGKESMLNWSDIDVFSPSSYGSSMTG